MEEHVRPRARERQTAVDRNGFARGVRRNRRRRDREEASGAEIHDAELSALEDDASRLVQRRAPTEDGAERRFGAAPARILRSRLERSRRRAVVEPREQTVGPEPGSPSSLLEEPRSSVDEVQALRRAPQLRGHVHPPGAGVDARPDGSAIVERERAAVLGAAHVRDSGG